MRDDMQRVKGTREAAVLSQAEIARMKASTKIQSANEAAEQKRIMEEQKAQRQAMAKTRKQKMIQMDGERSKKLPPTEIEVEASKKAEGLLAKAQEQLDEEHDDVKHMNQMVLYAKVVTVRDKQLDENKRLEQEWLQEQKKLDLMMEIERLKALQQEEEREKLRVEAQRRGAAVIIDQIKQREVERAEKREQLEKEQA